MGTIDEAYMETIDVIENFRANLTMSNMDRLLVKADQLDAMATEYKDKLYCRAKDERAMPTFSAVNLSNRLSVVDTEDRPGTDQHTRNEQDITIQPGDSSTPTNPLDGIELQLDSNNDIEIIDTCNSVHNDSPSLSTPPLRDADPSVPTTGADSGALPLYPTGVNAYNRHADTEEEGNHPENFLSEVNKRYELGSATQGNNQLEKTIREIVEYTKKNREMHDSLTEEMIRVRNDQTRRIISLEQGLAKANSLHSALSSEFKEKMKKADDLIVDLNTSVGTAI